MKKRIRQSLLVGVAATSLGLAGMAGAGMASADSNTGGQTSLIEKIATKFNLNKDQVAAVFAADRTEHQAQMQADQASRLAQAVTDGKLTQTQADYLTSAQKEIGSLMSGSTPDQQTDAQRATIKTKMDALRSWAKANNIDQQYIGGGMGGHGGGTPPAGSGPTN